MKLSPHVLPKGPILDFLPIVGRSTAQSLGAFILLPDAIYRNLQTDRPDPANIALLIHEEVHLKRQKELGFVRFVWRYLFDPKFRFQEEILAIKEAMRYLKKNDIAYNFSKNAEMLSGYLYLWQVSKEYAEKELLKAWDEV